MISILLVGGDELVRGALAAVLAHENDLHVAADLSLQDDVVVMTHRYRPDVVIIDLDRYGAEELDPALRLAQELPECRVLVLTSHPSTPMLRRALAAGVRGLVSRDSTPGQLVRSIRQLAGGERVVEPGLAVTALRPTGNLLTDRERAVLALAGAGLRAREIGERLFLSTGTVRNYLSSAKRKTGARNRLDAFRRAREEGWL